MLRKSLQRLGRSFGLDIRGFDPRFNDEARKRMLLRDPALELFVDVGANTGQFGRWLRSAGYKGRILSFEPGREAFKKLEEQTRRDPLWLARNLALGAEAGVVELGLSADSHSSSVLRPTGRNLEAHAGVGQTGAERVEMVRLDEALAGEGLPEGQCLGLKADTQGSEDAVLAGAAGVIGRVRLLVVELSLVPLYEGQKLLCDLLPVVRGMGFYPVVIEPCDVDYGRMEILQLDVWFLSGGAAKDLPEKGKK